MKHLLTATLLFTACGAVVAAESNLSIQDRVFVDRAAQYIMTQSHIGELAQHRAESQDIKNLGNKVQNEYGSLYGQLAAIAQHNGYKAPAALDVQDQRAVKPLENLSGAKFDRRFQEYETRDSLKGLDWLRTRAFQLQNADLKSFASQMIATMEKSMASARSLVPENSNGTADRSSSGKAKTKHQPNQ